MNFERTINYYELDGMNVVHHSNYIRYMEEARIYLLDKIGLPYKLYIDTTSISYLFSLTREFAKDVMAFSTPP